MSYDLSTVFQSWESSVSDTNTLFFSVILLCLIYLFQQLLAMQRLQSSQNLNGAEAGAKKQPGGKDKGRVAQLKPGGEKVEREGSKACVIQ